MWSEEECSKVADDLRGTLLDTYILSSGHIDMKFIHLKLSVSDRFVIPPCHKIRFLEEDGQYRYHWLHFEVEGDPKPQGVKRVRQYWQPKQPILPKPLPEAVNPKQTNEPGKPVENEVEASQGWEISNNFSPLQASPDEEEHDREENHDLWDLALAVQVEKEHQKKKKKCVAPSGPSIGELKRSLCIKLQQEVAMKDAMSKDPGKGVSQVKTGSTGTFGTHWCRGTGRDNFAGNFRDRGGKRERFGNHSSTSD